MNLNVSIAQKNPSCKICINLALIFTNLLLNIDMNVNIAQKLIQKNKISFAEIIYKIIDNTKKYISF